jgi:predicted Zn-dependent peptidase
MSEDYIDRNTPMKAVMAALLLLLFMTGKTAYTQTFVYQFENGFDLVVSESRQSGLTGMTLLIFGGTRYEQDEERGTYRLISDMLRRGTKSRSADQIAREIAQLGGSFKTYVAADYWGIEASVAPKNLADLLDLLQDLLFNPVFSDDELKKATRIAVGTIRSLDDSPLHSMFDFYRSVFYPDFYASPEERIENLEAMSRKNLVYRYEQFFTPGNMVMALTGNLETEEAFWMVSERFGVQPQTGIVLKGQELKQRDESLPPSLEKRGGVTQAGIFVGTRLKDFDRGDGYLMELVNTLLDNSIGGRLFDEIREKEGLVYSITPYHSARVEPYTWFVFATTRRKNRTKVLRKTEEVLNGLLTNPPTEEELMLAKSYLKTKLAMAYSSPINSARYEALRRLRGEEVKSLEERILEIDSVHPHDINQFLTSIVPAQWTKLAVY